MRKPFFLFLFCFFINHVLISQDFREVENFAFKKGEKLKYRVYYDSWLTAGITAGIGTLSVKQGNRKFNDRNTYHIEVVGKSVGVFNLFFKVRDNFESFMDETALIPWYFVRRTKEGSFKKDDDVTFNQIEHYAQSNNGKIDIPPNVQDIVSSFYYLRNFDFDQIKNNELSVNFYLDDTVYNSKISFLGKEIVETEIGTFNCLKFSPMMATGEVFDDPYPLSVWITDDKNRIPVLLESKIIVGSVKIELIKYSGLANPLTSEIE
ncbi:MAG: DUF3108 domain-containing protein [Bacteroidales bacterium]|nr:DUF3108 domain-containing protein [Bacteroidales bacterium]